MAKKQQLGKIPKVNIVSVFGALLIVFFIYVAYDQWATDQQAEITALKNERDRYRTLLVAATTDIQSYKELNDQASGTALLLVDAYQQGGFSKAQDVYHGFESYHNQASGVYDKLMSELKDFAPQSATPGT